MILISAFFININKKTDAQIDEYIKRGKKLMNIPIPKVIIIDELLFEQFKDYKNEYTQILFANKNIFYLYEHLDEIINFNINGDPDKDTLEYIFTMNHKLEYVREAIKVCPSNHQFIWIDFAIDKILSYSEQKSTHPEGPTGFIEKMLKLSEKNYDKVRIGSIWDLNINYNTDIFKDISWYFSGGVFGGNSESLIKLANLVKQKCLDIIKERKTLMWEVNIWYLVYQEHPELFDIYKCDHNDTIINNY